MNYFIHKNRSQYECDQIQKSKCGCLHVHEAIVHNAE